MMTANIYRLNIFNCFLEGLTLVDFFYILIIFLHRIRVVFDIDF